MQVINWSAKDRGGLVATCYVQAALSPLGRLRSAQIHERAQEIGQSILGNTRKRDPGATLRKVEALMQDNYPIVYIERTVILTNIQFTSKMDIYAIVTAWKGREILFECASDVPNRWEHLRPKVESEILKVMRTLSFTR